MKNLLRRIVRVLNDRAGLEVVKTHFYVRNLAERETPVLDTSALAWGWELLKKDQAERFASIAGLTVAQTEERLRRGDRCYHIERDGKFLHYSWAQYTGLHPVHPAAQEVEIRAKQLCIYHCYTDEAARGMGLYPATLRHILKESADEGCTLGWIYTTGDNVASQKGILKAGFRWVHSVRALRLGRYWHPLSMVPERLFEAADCPDRSGAKPPG